MAGQIILFSLAAMCLATGGFVGGLMWSARELGATEHRGFGLKCCIGFAALGLACLIAGTVA